MERVQLLKDVFIGAYERSALRYTAMRQSLGEPDPFRLKYRDAMKNIITQIVHRALPPAEARVQIQNAAMSLPELDRTRFMDAVEKELLSLHDGNIARYWIRPSEFKNWQAVWKSKTGR